MMADRKTLTAADLLPGYEISFEQVEVAEPKPAPGRGGPQAGKQGPVRKADRGDDAPVESAGFVSLEALLALEKQAGRMGWAARKVDLQRTVRARLDAKQLKDNAVNLLLEEARRTRTKASVFVVLVGRVEMLTLEHLRAGLALADLLEPVAPKTSCWPDLIGRPGVKARVSNRPVHSRRADGSAGRRLTPVRTFERRPVRVLRVASDGGMAEMADRARHARKVWDVFLQAAEAEGVKLSGKAGFGQACKRVIRGDSGLEDALKAVVGGRLSTIRNVAHCAMVAGLAAAIPMLARRK